MLRRAGSSSSGFSSSSSSNRGLSGVEAGEFADVARHVCTLGMSKLPTRRAKQGRAQDSGEDKGHGSLAGECPVCFASEEHDNFVVKTQTLNCCGEARQQRDCSRSDDEAGILILGCQILRANKRLLPFRLRPVPAAVYAECPSMPNFKRRTSHSPNISAQYTNFPILGQINRFQHHILCEEHKTTGSSGRVLSTSPLPARGFVARPLGPPAKARLYIQYAPDDAGLGFPPPPARPRSTVVCFVSSSVVPRPAATTSIGIRR